MRLKLHDQYRGLLKIKIWIYQYQDHIFLRRNHGDMNILPWFIFNKTGKIFIPPSVRLGFTWNRYHWIHNLISFKRTLRLHNNSTITMGAKSKIQYLAVEVYKMSWKEMFEIITSIHFPNHVPGTMPSLSIFTYLDSTHFSEFSDISYMVISYLPPQ